MAKSKSAAKRARQSEKRRIRNRAITSTTKTYLTRARALITQGEATLATEATIKAISALDRAVAKGVIHRNNAARRKSRLTQKLNLLTAPPPAN